MLSTAVSQAILFSYSFLIVRSIAFLHSSTELTLSIAYLHQEQLFTVQPPFIPDSSRIILDRLLAVHERWNVQLAYWRCSSTIPDVFAWTHPVPRRVDLVYADWWQEPPPPRNCVSLHGVNLEWQSRHRQLVWCLFKLTPLSAGLALLTFAWIRILADTFYKCHCSERIFAQLYFYVCELLIHWFVASPACHGTVTAIVISSNALRQQRRTATQNDSHVIKLRLLLAYTYFFK